MFQVSKQVDYAIALVGRLAELDQKQCLSLKKFSTESNISFLFLQKIARSLKQAGLVDSTKGPTGGYRIAKQIGKITLKDIIDAVEGGYSVVDCIKDENLCKKTRACKTKKIWRKMQKNIINELENTLLVNS